MHQKSFDGGSGDAACRSVSGDYVKDKFGVEKCDHMCVCEQNGQIILIPPGTSQSYRTIIVDHKSAGVEDVSRSAFLQTSEPTPMARVISSLMDEGLSAALSELCVWLCAQSKVFNDLRQRIFKGVFEQPELQKAKIMTSNPVKCYAWHPDLLKLAYAQRDDMVKIVNIESGAESKLRHRLQKDVQSLSWYPLGAAHLAVSCKRVVLVWHVDPLSGATKPSTSSVTFFESDSSIASISWHPQSTQTLLISFSHRSYILLWNTCMGSHTYIKTVWPVCRMTFSPDSRRLVISGTKRELGVLETTSNCRIDRWKGLESSVSCIRWSPLGEQLLFSIDGRSVLFQLGSETSSELTCIIPTCDLADCQESSDCHIRGPLTSFDWNGKRLAAIFQATNAVFLYKTFLEATVRVSLVGCILNFDDETSYPTEVQFSGDQKSGAILMIAWSSGHMQSVPLYYQ